MEIFCRIFPADGLFRASASYDAGEMTTPYFLLNREFSVDRLICGGSEIPVESDPAMIAGWDYAVQKIPLPPAVQALRVEYTGRLSGKTGAFPYVRERITPAFTLLRWETFPFPLFCPCSEEDIHAALFLQGDSRWSVRVPAGYEVVATERLTEKQAAGGETEFLYDHARQLNDFSCAVAPYRIVRTAAGVFYLFHDCLRTDVAGIMRRAHRYMDAHFGVREISADTVFAAIPEGLGNFAIPGTNVVFIQESAFRSLPDMTAVIHEFIHLGWNARAAASDRRLRFFDEAFTCYFQMRVMDALTGKEDALPEFRRLYQKQTAGGEYRLVPICEFGRYEYGDLSYSLGPLFFHALCAFLGQGEFDRIMTSFLKKYRETPVTLKLFCTNAVENAAPDRRAELRNFLQKWLYTTEESQKYLQNHRPEE